VLAVSPQLTHEAQTCRIPGCSESHDRGRAGTTRAYALGSVETTRRRRSKRGSGPVGHERGSRMPRAWVARPRSRSMGTSTTRVGRGGKRATAGATTPNRPSRRTGCTSSDF
jgi:hypothetical protein